MAGYLALSDVYEWLIPDAKMTPAGAAAAFGDLVATLPPGARVLDCACGTGQLAVGLAGLGLDVVAADASGGMVRRTQELADEVGVSLRTLHSTWDELPDHLDASTFDLVFCVGNSLGHAEGAAGRSTALVAMSRLLSPGGRLVLTSRTWELERSRGSTPEIDSSAATAAMLSSPTTGRSGDAGSRSTTSRSPSHRWSRTVRSRRARSGCPSGHTATRSSWRSCGASDFRSRPARSTPRSTGTRWSPAASRPHTADPAEAGCGAWWSTGVGAGGVGDEPVAVRAGPLVRRGAGAS